MKELLDIATDEAAGKEEVNALFPPEKAKGKAKREEDPGDEEDLPGCRDSRKKKKGKKVTFVVMAAEKPNRPPTGGPWGQAQLGQQRDTQQWGPTSGRSDPQPL